MTVPAILVVFYVDDCVADCCEKEIDFVTASSNAKFSSVSVQYLMSHFLVSY